MIYVIMKTMCSTSYQLNGFVENHGLGTCCMVKT